MYIVITVAAVEAAAVTAVVSSAAAAIILVVAVTYITGVYMYIPIYSNGGRSTPAASSAVAACVQQFSFAFILVCVFYVSDRGFRK